MQGTVPTARIFRFGLFEADVAHATLTRNGVRVKIQDQPFRVLILLLERPGELVSREELRQRLWPEGTFVDFDGSLNVILKKLRAAIDDASDNPRFIETVPRRGYRFIAPVSQEPTAVGTLSPAISTNQLSGVPPATTSPVDVPTVLHSRSGHRRSILFLASGLAVVVGIAAWLMFRSGQPRTEASGAEGGAVRSVPMRRSIAVLGFRNLSGNSDDAWLGTALSEMLSTELAGGDQLRLVSGEDVANLRNASPWSSTDSLDQTTTSRIGAALSSDLLILGSYTRIAAGKSAQLRLDVRMQDSRTGEILTEFAETGGGEDLFRLVFSVGSRLRNRLGIPEVQMRDQAGILAALPLNREAARFYAMGILKLREFDALAAKDLLLQATAADPKFCLGHAMLARAWGQLGYDQKHRQEAKRALELSADLGRADKMLVEGEYYDSLGNHEQAATVYDALFQLFPDNVDYGLRFATAEIKSGNSKKALSVIAQLRALPAPASADPRIDLVESGAIKVNNPASLALVRSAVRKASLQGRTPIYAQAKRDECIILIYGEQPATALPACEEAYNLFLSAGNRAGAADAVRLIGDRQGAEGHYAEAIATYERALSLLSGLGEHGKTGAILNNMAIGFANQGKLDLAQKYYEEAKSHFEEVGEKINTATAITNIADILFLRGNLSGAEREYRHSIDLVATSDHADYAYELYRLADLELAQGNIRDAKAHAQQAIAAYRASQGSFQYLTGAMVVLGEILEAEGDLAGARSQFTETLNIRQKVGESDLVAESQVELANLSIEEGHPEEAVPLLEKALAVFEKERADPDASSAYTKLSRALLLLGKKEEARAAADSALRLSNTSSDPALQLPASIQIVQVESASTSDSGQAPPKLRAIAARARKLGYFDLECEARLALAQAQSKTNPASANSQLSALAGDARSRGFNLMARKAERSLPGSGGMLAATKLSH